MGYELSSTRVPRVIRTGMDLKSGVQAVVSLLLAMILAGCQVLGRQPPQQQRLVTVERGTVVETVSPTGVVVAGRSATLNFAFAGILKRYDVSLGQTVKQGQILAELDSSAQEAAAAEAEAGLALAKDRLAGVTERQPGTVAQSKGNLEEARAKLQAIQHGARPATVAQAKAALDAAEQKLAEMMDGPRPEVVAQAQANVSAAQAGLNTAEVNLQSARRNAPLLLASAEARLQSARDALLAAQTSRDGVCGNPRIPSYQCQAANASVQSAQDSVTAAATAVTQQQAENASAITIAKNAVSQAKAQLAASQAALALAEHPDTPQEVAAQQDAVTQAKAALDLAEHPYTATDLAQARAAVESAQGALASAEHPYTASDLAQAEDAVKQAEAAVQVAELNLSNTKLRAPFDGTVLSEPLAPGDYVGTNSNPIVLGTTGTGTQGLEVNASVDEVDVAKVRVGQPVTISAVAIPGRVFHGKVAVVPPQGVTVLNVVTYPTYIQLDDGQNVLRPGMTVSCTIEVAKHSNTLVVPTAAVSDIAGKTYVVLPSASGGRPVPRAVTTGIASLSETEILSGLKAGDKVLLGVSPRKITVGLPGLKGRKG